MMNKIPAFLILTLAAIMQLPSRASAPSHEELEAWESREQQMKITQAKALPWKAALEKAFFIAATDTAHSGASSDTEKIVQFIFLTTYKHHIPVSVNGNIKPQAKEAKAFHQAWIKIKAHCEKTELNPLELAEAIYRFTNSDWAPVSGTSGPGLDKVSTPKEYQAWANAAIAAGIKAKQAGQAPSAAWLNQASSYQVRLPKDIAKTSPTAIQPRQ